MKALGKIIIALAALFGATGYAQARTVDIMASYGGYTQMDASNMHDGWSKVNNAWGALNVGVDFHLTKDISIGPSYTFSSTTTDGAQHSNISYHGILMNLRYRYWRTSIVTLYAHAGMGCEISHMQPRGNDAYNKNYFAFQAVPFGAEAAIGKNWSMYAELGFGVQGMLQFGFKYTL